MGCCGPKKNKKASEEKEGDREPEREKPRD